MPSISVIQALFSQGSRPNTVKVFIYDLFPLRRIWTRVSVVEMNCGHFPMATPRLFQPVRLISFRLRVEKAHLATRWSQTNRSSQCA